MSLLLMRFSAKTVLVSGIAILLPIVAPLLQSAPKVVETAPAPLSPIRPDFPKTLEQEGAEGRVKVQFIVRPDGSLDKILVIDSTHDAFSQAAIEALKAVEWKPGTRNGVPISCRIILPVDFRFQNGNEKVDTIPEPIEPIRPKYPSKLRRAAIEGTVILRFLITNKGSVRDIQVVRSDYDQLIKPAIKAIEKTKWRPARLDGRPIQHYLEKSIQFNL